MVTAQLICLFIFAFAKSRFSHDAAHIYAFFLIAGEVIGVNNCYEDSDRRTIDAAINGLKPNVFPQDYQLSYCDILDSVGNKISKK